MVVQAIIKLLNLVCLCVCIYKTESVNTNNGVSPLGPKMCKKLCESFGQCKSPRYVEKNLTCFLNKTNISAKFRNKIFDVDTNDKHKNIYRTIKTRLKGMVTVKLNSADLGASGGLRETLAQMNCPADYRHLISVEMCVKFIPSPHMDYADVTKECEKVAGRHVLHLDTNAKINAINTIIQSEYSGMGFYLGLNDGPKFGHKQGHFHWTDGTPVTDTNWTPGDPDNRKWEDCVALAMEDQKWHDIYCSDKSGVICEIDI